MQTLIQNYTNFPGEHCGSSAMRGLLNHYCGLELPEPVVFGLGSGVATVYLTGEGMDPARLLFGRSIDMETTLAENLQVDYREQTESDDDVAWQTARDEVLSGRPTMLSGDILYLDYREYKVHFPGHRFVLLGFDDATEKASIADRINVAPELCSYGALRTSRNPPEGMSTQNLWGRFHGTDVGRPLVEAARIAIARCCEHMLGTNEDARRAVLSSDSVGLGIRGVRQLADDLPSWGGRADASWVASYNARCIEKFGNGGGNFRRLYAGFLDWAHQLDPSLAPPDAGERAREAADGWTALSGTLAALAKGGAGPEAWETARTQANGIADLEEALFQRLAG